MAFHDRLKQARESAGFTQQQVASMIGVAKSTYSGYETGKSEPSMNNIANIMRILDVSPEFLWQDELEGQFRNKHPERFIYTEEQIAKSQDEVDLLVEYRKLIPSTKEIVLTTVRSFAGNPELRRNPNEESSAMYDHINRLIKGALPDGKASEGA